MADSPIINGFAFSWASLTVRANNNNFTLVKSIDYEQEGKPGDVFGAGVKKVARTRGYDKPTAKMTLYRAALDTLLISLGPAFGSVPFDIRCEYREDPNPMTVDDLIGALISKISAKPGSAGSDAASEVEVELNLTDLLWNGLSWFDANPPGY